MVVLVPIQENLSLLDYDSILNALYIWYSIVIVFSSLRKIFHALLARRPRAMIDLYFETFGIIYGNAAITDITSRSERILIVLILIVELFASIRCTGLFFSKYSGDSNREAISNFSDLVTKQNGGGNGKQLLCIPYFYQVIAGEMFEKKYFSIYPMMESEVFHHIYTGNRSCMYIVPEQIANNLMKFNDVQNMAPKEFRIINNIHLCMLDTYPHQMEQLYKWVLFLYLDGAYKMWFVRPFMYTRHIGYMMELASQHGIWKYFESDTKNVVLPSVDNNSEGKKDGNEIKMEQLKFIIWAYQLGNLIALIVFLVELLWTKLVANKVYKKVYKYCSSL